MARLQRCLLVAAASALLLSAARGEENPAPAPGPAVALAPDRVKRVAACAPFLCHCERAFRFMVAGYGRRRPARG